MVIDQPLVVYPKDNDAPVKHTKKKLDNVYEKWLAKKTKEGSLKGEQISLNDYFNKKIK